MHFLQHNLVSGFFVLTAIAMLVIAMASAGSLPGDGLYPVKLTAEEIGASVAGNSNDALDREANSDQRRLNEVTRMIESGRTGSVNFAGYLDFNEARWIISNIPLVLNNTQKGIASALRGGYIEINGTVNKHGQVEVTQIQPRLVILTGSVQAMETNQWIIDHVTVRLSEMTEVIGDPQLASQVTVHAVRTRNDLQMLAVKVIVTGVAAQPTGTPTPTQRPEMTLTPTLTPSLTETLNPDDSSVPVPTTVDDNEHENDSSDDDLSSEDDEEKDGDDEEEGGNEEEHSDREE